MRDPGHPLLRLVLSKLDGVRREGSRYKACCPAHTDSDPSLSVRLGDKGVLLKCYAGCEHADIVEALGLKQEELFFDFDARREEPSGGRDSNPRHQEPAHELGLTRAAFAEHKRLSEELLAELGVTDATVRGKRAVLFAYPSRDGKQGRTRVRLALQGKDRFRWDGSDAEVIAYEPDLGKRARASRTLCLVEGESDTLTLLSAGFGALGLPGADTTSYIKPHHLEGIDRVFVIREPDKGGDTFARNAPNTLLRLDYKGAVHVVRMPEGAKDASALYLLSPETFPRAMEVLLERADPGRSKSLADLLLDQAEEREVVRTDLEQFDRACDDGGIPLGRLCVFLGGPGSKKTGLGVHFADVLSRQGAAVLMICADEGRRNIVTRLGQRLGYNRKGLRDKAEIGEATRQEARRHEMRLGRLLRLVDPYEEDEAQTLEDAHIELLSQSRGRPRVLIVDSLQTVRSEAEARLDRPDQRATIDARMKALRELCRMGTLVILISETRRGFYAGDKPVTKEDVLSAAKESGGVEYNADLVAGLVRDKVEEELLELVVAKSRFGQEPRLRLRWDRERATLYELADDESREVTVEHERRQDPRAHKRDAVREEVFEMVRRRPGLTRAELRAALKRGRSVVYELLDELIADGRVVEDANGSGKRSPLYIAGSLFHQDGEP